MHHLFGVDMSLSENGLPVYLQFDGFSMFIIIFP